MENEFKVGDCVRLKSGGPIMAIEFINITEIRCQWFNDDEEINAGSFQPECLNKVIQHVEIV